MTASTWKTDNFSMTSTDLVVQSAPAGEHGVLAEARRCARLPAPPGGRVEHLQLRISQRPVDAHTCGLTSLLPAVGAAEPCSWRAGTKKSVTMQHETQHSKPLDSTEVFCLTSRGSFFWCKIYSFPSEFSDNLRSPLHYPRLISDKVYGSPAKNDDLTQIKFHRALIAKTTKRRLE